MLHHLTSPLAGLRALEGALAEGGGLQVMLYARYGRLGVYGLQHLLRLLLGEERREEGRGKREEVHLARQLLSQLPSTNQFKASSALFSGLEGDAGFYDLLLHKYAIHHVHTAICTPPPGGT